jgi:hypothetical protein
MTTYRANIWSAMSGDFDKLSVKTKKARRERLTRLFTYWKRSE